MYKWLWFSWWSGEPVKDWGAWFFCGRFCRIVGFPARQWYGGAGRHVGLSFSNRILPVHDGQLMRVFCRLLELFVFGFFGFCWGRLAQIETRRGAWGLPRGLVETHITVCCWIMFVRLVRIQRGQIRVGQGVFVGLMNDRDRFSLNRRCWAWRGAHWRHWTKFSTCDYCYNWIVIRIWSECCWRLFSGSWWFETISWGVYQFACSFLFIFFWIKT